MKILWKANIPIETKSESNISEHWTKTNKRRKTQKTWIRYFWLKDNPKIELPCIIKLSRLSNRVLDDDNLPPAFKAIRDQIADLIIPGLAPGRADGDRRIKWEYEQKKGTSGIEITIYQC